MRKQQCESNECPKRVVSTKGKKREIKGFHVSGSRKGEGEGKIEEKGQHKKGSGL